MGMPASLVDTQIAKLLAAERASRQHAFHGFYHDAFRETAFENEFRRAFLEAALIAAVVIIDRLLPLAAGQNHFFGIDDDDVVAIVQMRRKGRLMLAAQPQGDQRGKPPDDEP